LRGLGGVREQRLLTAAAQNMKKIALLLSRSETTPKNRVFYISLPNFSRIGLLPKKLGI